MTSTVTMGYRGVARRVKMDGIANEAHLRTFLGDEVYRDYFETERGAEGGTSDTAHLELGGVNDASASVISDDDVNQACALESLYSREG